MTPRRTDLPKRLSDAQQHIVKLETALKSALEELEKTNSELLQLTLELEDRVSERTEALRQSENELRKHRDHLQDLVEDRTRELQRLNVQLKQRLNDLQASEERFRSLVVTIPDIVYRLNPDGCFTFINDAVKRLGYEPEELLGEHFSVILFPGEADRISRDIVLPGLKRQVIGKKKTKVPRLFDERRTGDRRTTGLEVRLITKERGKDAIGNGSILEEISSAGLYGIAESETNQKAFIGTVGVIRDISDRKRDQEIIMRQGALQEGIKRIFLETLRCDTEEEVARVCLDVALDLTHSPAGVVLQQEADGPCRALAAAGVNSAPDDGRSGNAGCIWLFWQKVMHQGVPEMINPREDIGGRREGPGPAACGERMLAVPVRRGDQIIGLIGLAHRTENYSPEDLETVEALALSYAEAGLRKRSELELKRHREHLEEMVTQRTRELRESQYQLIQSEKMGALGTLTAGIAHELNNPMMGILNFIQYALKHSPSSGKVASVLGDAERETLRCISIFRDLLTFSRCEGSITETPCEADFMVILKRILSLLSYRVVKEGVEIATCAASHVPPLWVRGGHIQQVFLNLLTNALDAVMERETKRIQIEIHPSRDEVAVKVSDTGSGISVHDLPRIFDPFFTTKPPGKGTGLGLCVSRSIVEAHGGRILCESQLGHGTTFTVWLPAATGKEVKNTDLSDSVRQQSAVMDETS